MRRKSLCLQELVLGPASGQVAILMPREERDNLQPASFTERSTGPDELLESCQPAEDKAIENQPMDQGPEVRQKREIVGDHVPGEEVVKTGRVEIVDDLETTLGGDGSDPPRPHGAEDLIPLAELVDSAPATPAEYSVIPGNHEGRAATFEDQTPDRCRRVLDSPGHEASLSTLLRDILGVDHVSRGGKGVRSLFRIKDLTPFLLHSTKVHGCTGSHRACH